MDEINPIFEWFVATSIGPVLANPPKEFMHRQQQETTMINTKVLHAPFLKMLDENCGIIDKITFAYTSNRADRADLYQEIIYKLWVAYPDFKGNSKVSTWLYTVALRSAIMPFRRARMKIELSDNLPETPTEMKIPEAEMDDRLFHLFNKLENFDRGVLMLLVEGYTAKEIGLMLGLTEGSIYSRINRVRKAVKNFNH